MSKTITQTEITQATRDADAVVEEYGLDVWCGSRGVEPSGLQVVSKERAAQLIAITTGQPLQSASEETLLSSLWIDGFAAGLNAQRQRTLETVCDGC